MSLLHPLPKIDKRFYHLLDYYERVRLMRILNKEARQVPPQPTRREQLGEFFRTSSATTGTMGASW